MQSLSKDSPRNNGSARKIEKSCQTELVMGENKYEDVLKVKRDGIHQLL